MNVSGGAGGDIGAFEFGGLPLRIFSIARNGADIVVTFQAAAGAAYRLERKCELTNPAWKPIPGVGDLRPDTSGLVPITDRGAINLGHAFYRNPCLTWLVTATA